MLLRQNILTIYTNKYSRLGITLLTVEQPTEITSNLNLTTQLFILWFCTCVLKHFIEVKEVLYTCIIIATTRVVKYLLIL